MGKCACIRQAGGCRDNLGRRALKVQVALAGCHTRTGTCRQWPLPPQIGEHCFSFSSPLSTYPCTFLAPSLVWKGLGANLWGPVSCQEGSVEIYTWMGRCGLPLAWHGVAWHGGVWCAGLGFPVPWGGTVHDHRTCIVMVRRPRKCDLGIWALVIPPSARALQFSRSPTMLSLLCLCFL